MRNDETAPTGAGQAEGQVSVQGAIESVGIREVLRLARSHAPARLVVQDRAGGVAELWWTADGVATLEPSTTPEEVLAEILTFAAGSFAVSSDPVPAVDAVPFDDALATAESLAPLWAEVAAVVPDRRAVVRLRRQVAAPVEVSATQWRVLHKVASGRGIGDLAALLRCSERASQRVVAELLQAGLVEVVRPPVPLTAPPTGPALAAPVPAAPGATAPAGAVPPPPGAAVPPLPAFAAPTVTVPDASDASDAFDVSEAGWDADVPADRSAASTTGWSDDGAAGASDGDDRVDVAGLDLRAFEDDATADAPDDDWGASSTAPAAGSTPSAGAAAPAVADSWSDEPAPRVRPSGWAWETDPADAEADDGWGTPGAAQHDDIEWDPVPEGAPAAPAPVAGFIEDPAAPHDEVLGSTDEELVNRALLFKFLSSVRE